MHRTRLACAGVAAGVAFVALSAGPASAHVYTEETEVAAGAFSQVTLVVPHGCEGSPTTALEIEVPEGVNSVTPEVHPGWDITVATEPVDPPIEGSHGEQITERDAIITVTAQPGSELADDFRTSFVFGYQAPDAPDTFLFWKTIQTCVEGETAWVTEYTGEGEEPEAPSPVVAVIAAEGGHGAEEEMEEPEEEAADTTVAAEPISASDDDDDGVDLLSIVALAVGAAGLAFGHIAFARTRSSS
jgi:uncharacterized protein YcnI